MALVPLIARGLAAWICASTGDPGGQLEAAAEVRALSPAAAGEARPVRLEGVVTFAHRATFGTYGFVQDSTAGVYFEFGEDRPPAPGAGELVRIEGTTRAGEFAPIVHATRLERVGLASPPAPTLVSAADLADGSFDSRWVRVRGQIRAVHPDRVAEVDTVDLASGDAQVRLDFVDVGAEPLEALWGAVVDVEGVCASIFNERRQLLSVRLMVPGRAHVRVVRPGPEHPFALPSQPVASVLSFDAAAPFRALHRVRGVVGLADPSGAFVVQDPSGGLRVYAASAPALGASVDVVGFAEPGDLGPRLVAARHRPTPELLPPLEPIRPDALLTSGLDGRLVRVEGEVVDVFEDDATVLVSLRLRDAVVPVALRKQASRGLPSAVRTGSRIAATGVVELTTDRASLTRSPDRFALAPTRARLFLRSRDDVVLLEAAPWWTPSRVAVGLAALLGVAVTAVAWGAVLRRRVRSQTEIIRDQLDREAALRVQAEAASSAKDVFLANISHELRTPMNGVLGYADLLCASPEMGPEHREQIGVIKESGQRLLRLLDDLLDFSKIEAGGMTLEGRPTAVRALVDGCLELVRVRADPKGLALAASIDDRCPEVILADGARLEQILLNLLTNALKFTTAGSICVNVRPGAKGLRFEVRDTGVGLSLDEVERLFERFSQADASTTRNFGGTGLGLAICKGLVEAMGGRIGANGEPGRGSCFWFEVPALETSTRPSASEPGRESTDRKLRTLLVDDIAVNRKLGERMLQRLGHAVDLAADGEEAMIRLRERRYDVVFMDLHMPRMDGLTCARTIREQLVPGAQPYIIALTADAAVSDRSACLEAGMNDHLSKPLTLKALAAVLALVPSGSAEESAGGSIAIAAPHPAGGRGAPERRPR